MKDRIEENPKLSVDERNLLSVAYKNVVGARRNAWRVIYSILQRNPDAETAKDYLATIEKDLNAVCAEVVVRQPW